MASNDEQRSATTIFTTAAQSIAARLIANKTTAKFTKAEISTTNLFNQSVTELQVLTSLDNVQQTADINTVTVINDNTVDVNVAIDQTKAPNDYQMNSVGLFAVDGDGKEVLYSVTVLKDPVYIHQDAMGSALGIDLETVVGQFSNVDLSINPAGAVTNEALKVTLADYVKTDDVKSLIPATVIDGSKPADFKEAVTLEKGAVDGAGNVIATTKNVADGDAATLKSAKDYADTKVSGKADDSTVVHTADMRKPANQVASIDEVNAKQDKLDYTPANDTNVVHRNPNTGTVSESVDFAQVPSVKGVSVATSDDLKSLETSAWRQLDPKFFQVAKGSSLYPFSSSSVVVYKIDYERNRLYFMFNFNGFPDGSSSIYIDFSSIVKTISVPSNWTSNSYMHASLKKTDTTYADAYILVSGNKIQLQLGTYSIETAASVSSVWKSSDTGFTNYDPCFVSYDELV